MKRPNILSYRSFALFSDDDGDTLWQGPPWRILRALILGISASLVGLLSLLVVIEIQDGSMLEEAVADTLPAAGWILMLFFALVLPILHNRVRIRAVDGTIERRFGRFPPYFTTKLPIDEFEGVRFWFDVDGGEPSLPVMRSEDLKTLGAMVTIELSHAKRRNIVTKLRAADAQWYYEEQLNYSQIFGLPVFLPGSSSAPRHFESIEELKAAAYQEIFNVDEQAPKSGGAVRCKQRNSTVTISFPYAAFDFVHSISHLPIVYGLFALAFITGMMIQEGPNVIVNNINAFIIAGSIVFAVAVLPSLVASSFRRHIIIDDKHISGGLKTSGERPRVAVNAIVGFCVGRRITRFSWRRGTFALWALTNDGAHPIAFGMSERTYSAVLNACKKACGSVLRP